MDSLTSPSYLEQTPVPEEAELSLLPQLAALLSNPWFRHFAIKWLKERQERLEIHAELPVQDLRTSNLREQVYGEVRQLKTCALEAYEKYQELVATQKQHEQDKDTKTQ